MGIAIGNTNPSYPLHVSFHAVILKSDRIRLGFDDWQYNVFLIHIIS